MSEFSYSPSPPAHWSTLCEASGALFSTAAWQDVLERGFGCRTLYVARPDFGVAISSFRAGPFRIGYLGFPAGSFVGDPGRLAESIFDIKTSDSPERPVCLRMSLSPFSDAPEFDLPYVTNPETAITDLQNWDATAVSKKLRRDLRKVEKQGYAVAAVPDDSLSDAIYEMYESTVSRHQGALRYTREYFAALCALGQVNERVRVFGATKDDRVAGFAITLRHGDTTFYLHGGTHDDFRRDGPSDQLLLEAISRARSDGSATFNLMASPPDQPMLVRYKEKWGGETRELRTYTLPLRFSYRLFRAAESLYRTIR